MPRVFKKIEVTFERQVVERQAVTVAVDPELDEPTQHSVARQLAAARLKDAGWEPVKIEKAGIVEAGKKGAVT
jgi:hypothetical protein